MRLAVSSPDGLGDFILREPLFASLRRSGHEIVVLCRPSVRPAVPWVAPGAQVIEIPIDPFQPFAIEPSDSINALWRDLTSWNASGLVIASSQRTLLDEALMQRWTSGPVWGIDGGRYPSSIDTAQTIGLATPSAWPTVPASMPEPERNRMLARAILGSEIPAVRPSITANDAVRQRARTSIDAGWFDHGPYWIACVGEDDRSAGRNWRTDRWADLMQHAIDQHGWRLLLVGTPNEEPANRFIAQRINRSEDSVRLWTGQTNEFATLVGLIAESVGYLGKDTGTMHLSAALQKPVFAVFGGGTWPRFLPQTAAGVAITQEVPCQGCGWYCHHSSTYCVKEIPFEPVRSFLDESARQMPSPLRVGLLPRPAPLAIRMEREAAQRARGENYRLALAHWEKSREQVRRRAEVLAARPKIHLGFPFYGAGNIGDDLMVDGFLQWMNESKLSYSMSACISSAIASQSRRFPEIHWTPASVENRARQIAACDVWLGLGGTPFQNDSGPWMLDYLVTEVELCRRHGKPMYFLGVGVGNASAVTDPRARQVIDYATMIWTRGDRSARLLRGGLPSDKIITGADLAHLSLRRQEFSEVEPDSLGWIIHFENQDLFSLSALSELLDSSEFGEHQWLVQEVRELGGSERATFGKLSPQTRARLTVSVPDYEQSLSAAELLSAWPAPNLLVSSRYHGLMIGAWAGARLLAVERNDKLAGAAESLDCARIGSLCDAAELRNKIESARPVERTRLLRLAEWAERSCRQFATALEHHMTVEVPAQKAAKEIQVYPEEFEGEGWYVTENDGKQSFRWMGEKPSATLVIRRPDPAHEGEFHCSIPHAIDPHVVDGIKLRFNGQPGTHAVQRLGRGWEIVARVSADHVSNSDRLEIELTVPSTRRPIDMNPKTADGRRLGVAVGVVSFRSKAA